MLQKILAAIRSRWWHVSLLVTDCAKQLKCGSQILADLAHRRQITTSIAVVWGAPNRHHVLIVKMVLKPLINQLMRARDERQIVDVAELVRNLITKKPAYS